MRDWAIGVDSDQYDAADPSVQGVIMTSMLENVNITVFEDLTRSTGTTFPSGVDAYDLSVDGIGYSTTGRLVDDIAGDLDAQAADHRRGDHGPDHSLTGWLIGATSPGPWPRLATQARKPIGQRSVDSVQRNAFHPDVQGRNLCRALHRQ